MDRQINGIFANQTKEADRLTLEHFIVLRALTFVKSSSVMNENYQY